MVNHKKLEDEIQGFQKIWVGGYFEGDPLDPLTKSTYAPFEAMSVLHATYLRCIKPYVNHKTIALEIGPGGGAWTKTLLPSSEIWAIDAQSASHTNFYSYIPRAEKVRYMQVNDFSCTELPDNYFDYMFSFGTLCHVSFEGIEEYAKNLKNKLKPGANCFWMIADYEKYNSCVNNFYDQDRFFKIVTKRFSLRKTLGLLRIPYHYFSNNGPKTRPPDKDDFPSPGRWYNAGLARTCAMLKDLGYEVLDPDVGTCLRDPIIHFRKV